MNGRLIVSEGGRDRIHELCDDRTIVGRGIDADLHLRSADAAPAHCEVKRTATGFKVVDLETAAGTKVNGNLVNQHVLQNGDTIQVGAARITYLGDSGAAERPTRKAPPPPLTVHPTDEEGEPRRFYRHEQKPGLAAGPKAALILATLSVLALILVWMAKSVPNKENVSRYNEAIKLLDNEDATSIERALAILKGLPPGTVHERDLEHMIETAEGRLFDLKGEVVDQEAEDEYARIMQYHESHKDDLGYLEGQIRYFRDRFPGAGQLEKLEATLNAARGGGEEGRKKWEAAQKYLRHALKNDDFRGAFAAIGDLEADPIMVRAHSARIATYRRAFERGFKNHFTKMKERALSAHESGDTARARRIYQQLAAVGLEPYASQAKTLLASLR